MHPIKIHHEYCAFFAALFVSLNVCVFYLKFCCIFPDSFLCLQIKLELFSTKELTQVRVYRKSATIAQTDGGITTEEPLYTGLSLDILCYTNIHC